MQRVSRREAILLIGNMIQYRESSGWFKLNKHWSRILLAYLNSIYLSRLCLCASYVCTGSALMLVRSSIATCYSNRTYLQCITMQYETDFRFRWFDQGVSVPRRLDSRTRLSSRLPYKAACLAVQMYSFSYKTLFSHSNSCRARPKHWKVGNKHTVLKTTAHLNLDNDRLQHTRSLTICNTRIRRRIWISRASLSSLYLRHCSTHARYTKFVTNRFKLHPTTNTNNAGNFSEARSGVCHFENLSGIVLEKVVEYFYYNEKHKGSTGIADMDIPADLCLELLMAADYLDTWRMQVTESSQYVWLYIMIQIRLRRSPVHIQQGDTEIKGCSSVLWWSSLGSDNDFKQYPSQAYTSSPESVAATPIVDGKTNQSRYYHAVDATENYWYRRSSVGKQSNYVYIQIICSISDQETSRVSVPWKDFEALCNSISGRGISTYWSKHH